MIETKVKSQNYLADPYNSLGHHLPFGTDQYVISAINFLSPIFFFPSHPLLFFSASCEPVTCQMTASEVSFHG